MGVPQDSIPSVTLFILKINSIADVIPSSFEKSLFVDDFLISCSSQNMASIERQLQLCLNKVENELMKMVLNFLKPKLFVCIFAIKENFIQTQHEQYTIHKSLLFHKLSFLVLSLTIN